MQEADGSGSGVDDTAFVLGGGPGEEERVRSAVAAKKKSARGGAGGAAQRGSGQPGGRRERGPRPVEPEEEALASSLFGADAGHSGVLGELGRATAEPADATASDADDGASGSDEGGEGSENEVELVPRAGRKRKAGAGAGDGDDSDVSDGSGAAAVAGAGAAAGAAWEDDDDAKVQVNIAEVSRARKLRTSEEETTITGAEYSDRLRKRFASANPGAAWAQRREDDDASGEMADVLRSTAPLFEGSGAALAPGRIQMTRLKDANYRDPSESVIQSVRFHPQGRLMLTAGFDKRLRFFQIDGTTNTKIQSVFFPDMPIHSAEFTHDGTQAVVSGRRPFFYHCDIRTGKVHKVARIIGREEKSLERFAVSPDSKTLAFTGKDGYIILVSNTSKQWIANLKMPAPVRALAFSSDGSQLLSTGVEGDVFRWDLRTRRALLRHKDEGSMCGTAIAWSADSKYYAVGSDIGVVNVYDADRAAADVAAATARSSIFAAMSATPKPLKSVMNLTTAIDQLKFSHDAQLLAMGSRRTKDALKLLHLPSFTVFSNWPTSKTPLHYVSSLDISPHSGLLSIGNDRGRVLLYRLNHYKRA